MGFKALNNSHPKNKTLPKGDFYESKIYEEGNKYRYERVYALFPPYLLYGDTRERGFIYDGSL